MELSEAEIRSALRSRLGDALAMAVAPDVAAVLRTYVPRHTALQDMASQVEKQLFRALYRELGVSMICIGDDGRRRRICTEELPELADRALSTLLMALPVTPTNYALLHDYAMASGSFAAISTLYRRFSDLQSAGETAIMAQILRTQCGGEPPSWLR